MAIRKDEHSYRSLLLQMAYEASAQMAVEGISCGLKHDMALMEATALDLFELKKAIDWLEGLDETLCPNEDVATVDELIAYEKAQGGTGEPPSRDTLQSIVDAFKQRNNL